MANPLLPPNALKKPVKQPKKARKPIRKVSKAMGKRMRAYRAQKELFLTQHPKCEHCLMPAEDLHHYRGRAGSLLTDWRFFIALCRQCHRRAHDDIEWARRVSLICPKGEWNTIPKD